MSGDWRVPLPRAPSRPTACSSTACRRRRAATTWSRAHELRFSRPLEKERIGLGRWTAMFLGLWGSYGKNDSVDVQYRRGGRDARGHGPGHHPARPTLTRLCQGSNLRRHAHRPHPRQPPPRVLVRVLPAEDRRRPADPRGHARDPARTTRPTTSRSPTAPAAPRASAPSRSPSGSSRTSASRRWPTSRCVGEAEERLVEILEELQAAGIENVLALRGDPPRGETEWKPHPGGLHYSVELIRLVKERFDFSIGAACFPEVHPEAARPRHATSATRARRSRRAPASSSPSSSSTTRSTSSSWSTRARPASACRSSRASCPSPT